MSRVGLVYDRFGDTPPPPGAPPDWDAEYEPEATVIVLEKAIRALGHQPVRVGSARALLKRMHAGGLDFDAAINIAESYGSRNREAHAPILLELAGVPCLGSDALTLSLSLDKAWTKDLAVRAGIPTPDWRVLRSADALDERDLPPFPLFVKPRYEGTAKGIALSSRVETLDALRAEVERQTQRYKQDVIVERFVEGSEFTVAVVGHPAYALPVLQRATERRSGIGLHALERHEEAAAPFDYALEGVLDSALEARLHDLALGIHGKLECRDFSRSDFRVDADGAPWFIEINPLPTFAPDGTFAIIAELMNRSYPDLLAEIIGDGLDRLGP